MLDYVSVCRCMFMCLMDTDCRRGEHNGAGLSLSASAFQPLSACQAFVQASVYHCLKIILRSCHNLCLHSLALLSNVAGSVANSNIH